MRFSYWSQWDSADLDSWQGKYLVESDDDDIDPSDYMDDDEAEEKEDRCPRCSGGGCNYCLMVEY